VAKIENRNGVADLSMLEEIDPTFAKYCRDGLTWDVLSHKIMDEDPEGLVIIQAACNVKNVIAMIPHEMEAVALLSRMCTKSAAVVASVSFASAKEKVALTLPCMSEDPDFLHLFRFVIDLGGDAAPFIPDLREFTARFLNPQAGCFDFLFAR
jgi:hypothetical protein